jgi:hypothetical protein
MVNGSNDSGNNVKIAECGGTDAMHKVLRDSFANNQTHPKENETTYIHVQTCHLWNGSILRAAPLIAKSMSILMGVNE